MILNSWEEKGFYLLEIGLVDLQEGNILVKIVL